MAQLALHHTPALQRLFGLEPLSGIECALSFAVGLLPVTIIEISKLVAQRTRSRHRRSPT